jgi:hypothetical protein
MEQELHGAHSMTDAVPRSAEPDPGLPQPARATGQGAGSSCWLILTADQATAHAASCVSPDINAPRFPEFLPGVRSDGSLEPIFYVPSRSGLDVPEPILVPPFNFRFP